MFELGEVVMDKVTKFNGTATARIQYLNGTTSYQVTAPVDKDGKPIDPQWIDENQLSLVAKKPAKLE
jgi:hypothetical protein